ncbi:MAG: low temperature requirement protein A [Acidimicrobiia bacterium]
MSTPSAFRRLWQPPARYEDRLTDRRVTFLELFFDLVFVVIVARLAHHLAEHPDWEGVGWFVFLFYAMWSCWVNGTMYYDLHGTDDVSVRVFTFAQMLAVAVMGVYVGDIPGSGAPGFALAYAGNVGVLVVIWYRTGLHDPSHRPASNPYSAAYLVSALLFVASVFVDAPGRYWMWALGLVVQVMGQVIAFSRWTPPKSQPGEAVIAVTPSLVERLGLFVIIVLGEVIVGAITGMADIEVLGTDGIVIGLLGVLVAIGLWWIYFDLVSHHPPISRRTQVWANLHFPLVAAVAAGGAGVLNTVEHAAEALPDAVRWLLVGALAAAMLTVSALTHTLAARRAQPLDYRTAEAAMYASVVLVLGVGLTDWGAKATLGALVVLLLAPVGVGLLVRLKRATVEDV